MRRVWQSNPALLSLFVGVGCLVALIFSGSSVSATAGTNPQLSFEGKVVNSNGTNIPDGTYNMEFKIYQDGTNTGSGSTLKWTEDRLVGGTPVTITGGTFQVNLGSVTAFGGSVDWNQNTLWLSMQVGNTSSCTITTTFTSNCGGDGEMTPFIRLTSTPYAFNSNLLDGIDSTALGQLASSQVWTGTNTINVNSSTAFLVQNAAGTSTILGVDTSGSTVTIGGTGVATTLNATSGVNTGATGGTQRIDASGNLVNIGDVTYTGSVVEQLGAANNTWQVQSSAAVAYITADTANSKIQVGSGTTDTTQILLQLDSYAAAAGSTADTASCTTSANQGALYYNTNSNAVRGCINGGWEDMVSTGSLGLQLFGVVPDSGSSNQGDIAGVTGLTNGPCMVRVGANTTTVAWNSCVAFSGGRKVIVAAGSASLSAQNNNWYHLCLTTANTSQPALSAGGAETLNLSSVSLVSTTAPILCLADVTTNASAIVTVYDTRTFTTTEKEFATVITTAPVLGQLEKIGSTTPGSVTPVTALQGTNIAGVVIATTGATSTNSVNAIIATSGLAAVKSITGTNTVGAYIESSATTGRAVTIINTTAVTADFALLGFARTAWTGSTTCVINSNVCAGSILTNINIR